MKFSSVFIFLIFFQTASASHIDLIAQGSSYHDEHGNQWRYQSRAHDFSGKELSVLDIYFVRHPELENDAALFDPPNVP